MKNKKIKITYGDPKIYKGLKNQANQLPYNQILRQLRAFPEKSL